MAMAAELTRRCTACNERYPADFLVCPRDATPLVSDDEAAADPRIGALLGDTYQIVRTIGEGGMGRVYEARHLRLKERRFAVKALHTELAKNPEMSARFLREASIASSIKHANVVDVFDVHHLADGTPYLVGEYLEGEELADYVGRQGPLEPRLAAKVGRQVCQALAAAHAGGVIHRDMKPENIFVLASSIAEVESGASRTLQVKVIDFGISKAGTSDALTRTGVIMGTPSYMSPEQARGQQVDARADIYAVGACLYFMVTGKRPFEGDDPTSTLALVLSQEAVRPREIDPRIPEGLELVIQHAMAKEAQDRYPTMLELDEGLATFLGGAALASNHALPSSTALAPLDGSNALDVAHAMLGVDDAAGDARTARPTIILASGALGGWLFAATVSALAGLVASSTMARSRSRSRCCWCSALSSRQRRRWRSSCCISGASCGRTACGPRSSRAISSAPASPRSWATGRSRSSRACCTGCSSATRAPSAAASGTFSCCWRASPSP